ncbi:hypothetical protein PM082_007422 [Marasmius tenuissimus]|nr:hypothetical protein PM082_007422 [Marasmius tenuissimus]
MNSLLQLLTFLSLGSPVQIHVMTQTREVTVNQTDTSQIAYGGGVARTVVFASMRMVNSYLDDRFKGSALRTTSLLSNDSPIFSVEIDGKTAEADDAQTGKAFTCYILFTVDGLDPKVERTRDPNIAIAGPFSWINYTYTAVDEMVSTTGNYQRQWKREWCPAPSNFKHSTSSVDVCVVHRT